MWAGDREDTTRISEEEMEGEASSRSLTPLHTPPPLPHFISPSPIWFSLHSRPRLGGTVEGRVDRRGI